MLKVKILDDAPVTVGVGNPNYMDGVDATAVEAAKEAKKSASEAAGSASDARQSLAALKSGIESGEFKGDKGDPGRDGVDGKDGATGPKGDDYILTDDDRSAIAAEATGQLQPSITSLENQLNTIDDVIIETVQPLKKQADETARSLDFLWKVNRGQTWDIEQREEAGHAQLPSGGEFGNLDEVRGKTEQESTNGYQLLNGDALIGKETAGNEYVFVNVEPSTQYTCRMKQTFVAASPGGYTTAQHWISFIDAENATISGKILCRLAFQKVGQIKEATETITTPDNCVTVRIALGPYFGANQAPTVRLDEHQFEKGSTAHAYEPYTGGIPSPNPDYPQEIVSVESIHILHTDANGSTLDERTVTPPRPLNKIGDYADVCDVVGGVWRWYSKPITTEDYAHSVAREPDYFLLDVPETEPVATADLDFLRSFTLHEGEDLFIIDNHGRDVSYLMSDFINLGKVVQ